MFSAQTDVLVMATTVLTAQRSMLMKLSSVSKILLEIENSITDCLNIKISNFDQECAVNCDLEQNTCNHRCAFGDVDCRFDCIAYAYAECISTCPCNDGIIPAVNCDRTGKKMRSEINFH